MTTDSFTSTTDLEKIVESFINLEPDGMIQKFSEEWEKLEKIIQEQKSDEYADISIVIEKILVTFCMLSDEESMEKKDVVLLIIKDVVLKVISHPSLSIDPKLIVLKLRAIDLFINLCEIFEDEINIYFPQILDCVLGFLRSSTEKKETKPQTEKVTAPSEGRGRGRGRGRGGRRRGQRQQQIEEIPNELSDDEEDESESSLYTTKNFTSSKLELLIISKSNQFLLFLSMVNKKLLSQVANDLWPVFTHIIMTSEDIQVHIGASELIAQLAMLSLTPYHVKIWDELRKEEDMDDEDDEDDGSMLLSEDNENELYPFYKPTMDYKSVNDIVNRLLALGEKYINDGSDLGLSSVVGILCAFVGEHFQEKDHLKIVTDTINNVVRKIEANTTKTTAKISLFDTLSQIIRFSLSSAIEPHFQKLYSLIETVEDKERKLLQEQPVDRGRGRRGRGRRARGRGRGGSKVDLEKEKDYDELRKKLALTLGLLSTKGGTHVLANASKFFSNTAPILKSNVLYIDYIISMEKTLQLTKNHPQRDTAKKLINDNLPIYFQDASEKASNIFILFPIKKQSILCITKIISANIPNTTNELFSEYIDKGLNVLLEVLDKDAYKIGPTVIVSLQKAIMANKFSKIIQGKIADIINATTKYLDLEEDPDREIIKYIKLACLDIIEFTFKQTEFKPFVQNIAEKLAPSVIKIMKTSSEITYDIHNFDDLPKDLSHQPNKALPAPESEVLPNNGEFVFNLGSPSVSPSSEFKFEFGKSDGSSSSEFKFDFGKPDSGASELSFNFGKSDGSSSSEFKFDFGKPSTEFKFDFATQSDSKTFQFDFGNTKTTENKDTKTEGFDFNTPFKFEGTGPPSTPKLQQQQVFEVGGANTEATGGFNFVGIKDEPTTRSGGRGQRGGRRGKRGGGGGGRSILVVEESPEEKVPVVVNRGGRRGGRASRGGVSSPKKTKEQEITEALEQPVQSGGIIIRGRGGRGRGGRVIIESSSSSGSEDDDDSLDPKTKKLILQGNFDFGLDSDEMYSSDSLLDSSDSDEKMEYAQLSIAAVDVSIAILEYIENNILKNDVVKEVNATLDLLGKVPALDKNDLNKRHERLEAFRNKK